MTEEYIKAAISSHFVQLIASRRGFKCSEPKPDEGVDLSVTRSQRIVRNGQIRHLDNGQYVDLQLKCTCESHVIRANELIKYDLDTKTYNDLVFRRESGALTPLVLVLLVLPDDPEQWVTVDVDELVVRRAA